MGQLSGRVIKASDMVGTGFAACLLFLTLLLTLPSGNFTWGTGSKSGIDLSLLFLATSCTTVSLLEHKNMKQQPETWHCGHTTVTGNPPADSECTGTGS